MKYIKAVFTAFMSALISWTCLLAIIMLNDYILNIKNINSDFTEYLLYINIFLFGFLFILFVIIILNKLEKEIIIQEEIPQELGEWYKAELTKILAENGPGLQLRITALDKIFNERAKEMKRINNACDMLVGGA